MTAMGESCKSYKGIQMHTKAYKGIQVHTNAYKGIQRHTKAYKCIQGIQRHTKAYKGIQRHTTHTRLTSHAIQNTEKCISEYRKIFHISYIPFHAILANEI